LSVKDDYIQRARRAARLEGVDEDMEDVEGEEEHVHEQPLNEQVLYDVSSDSRTHGRFAIANGAVRAADVRAAARERGLRPSNPVSLQSMAREMARLRRANARLQQANHEKDNALQHYKVTTELTLVHIYEALFSFLLLIFIHTSFCIYVLVLCLQGLCIGNKGMKFQRMHCNACQLPKQLQLDHLMLARSPLTIALMMMAMMLRISAEHIDSNIDASKQRAETMHL